MRARIVGRRISRPPAKRVALTGTYRSWYTNRKPETWMHWYATITDRKGSLLWADDCRDLGKLVDQARENVAAFNRLLAMGHKNFKTWDELVEGSRS